MVNRIYSVGIYARLSVEGSSRKNESIETQIEIAKEYMKGRGDMVLYGCYSDLGKTGTNFERGGFERLMEDVRHRRVDCVIVKDFSRFGRNYIETGNYIQKIFPFLGVRFVSVTDCFDSLFSQNDDIGINLKNLANEMYARDIALKVKSSKRAKRESGSYTGGIPPYGYRAEWICGKKSLFVEVGAAEIVKWIFAQYDEGRSLKEIAAGLYEQEVHRPTEYHRYSHLRRQPGEALHEWPRTSIKAVLTNMVYTGRVERTDAYGGNYEWLQLNGLGAGDGVGCRSGNRGGNNAGNVVGDGAGNEAGYEAGNGAEYGTVKENTHEAIVSRELFCRVAKRFEERAEKTKERESDENKAFLEGKVSPENKIAHEKTVSFKTSEEKDIFDGLLFCGCCGKKLGRRRLVKQSDLGGRFRNYNYFCRNSNKIDEFCSDTDAISKAVLTKIVRAALGQEAALNGILPERIIRENMKCVGERKAKIQKVLDTIQKQLKASDWAGSEQYRKYREGILSREAFLEWKARNEKKAEKARESLEEEKRRICEVDAEAKRQKIMLREMMEFSGKQELDGELIFALIERIRLYPDKRVEITFRFAFQGFTNMAGAGDGSEQEV